ncbi:Fic family protein [Fodinicola feengrottensis]|uniref:Fic family protein n=2 Tax=Fodinicola feengrottensis TaxID=435914 RepID=A0ABP4T0Q5_9ACTN
MMDLDRLANSPIGRLVPISGVTPGTGDTWRYHAFVPQPLPVTPALDMAALNSASKAAMEVARLDQAVSQLPNPRILVRPVVRREAASTAALEGTYATFGDVLEADFLEDRQLSSEQREIRNYVNATEKGVELLDTYPISVGLVSHLQEILVRGTSSEAYDSGGLRQRQVYIGPRNRPISEARYVPPPEGMILVEGMSDWEKWVNTASDVPLVAKIALAHYQFESLHPFSDGNGRIGRLVALLQLIQEGILRVPILNISSWLEHNRQEYLDSMLEVTMSGSYDKWVAFFSEAVGSQAKAGIAQIDGLLGLKSQMITELRAAGIRGSALEVAENLIGYPVIDVRTAQSMIEKSFEAANNAISRLVEQGILHEITGRTTNRLFACRRVLQLV